MEDLRLFVRWQGHVIGSRRSRMPSTIIKICRAESICARAAEADSAPSENDSSADIAGTAPAEVRRGRKSIRSGRDEPPFQVHLPDVQFRVEYHQVGPLAGRDAADLPVPAGDPGRRQAGHAHRHFQRYTR